MGSKFKAKELEEKSRYLNSDSFCRWASETTPVKLFEDKSRYFNLVRFWRWPSETAPVKLFEETSSTSRLESCQILWLNLPFNLLRVKCNSLRDENCERSGSDPLTRAFFKLKISKDLVAQPLKLSEMSCRVPLKKLSEQSSRNDRKLQRFPIDFGTPMSVTKAIS